MTDNSLSSWLCERSTKYRSEFEKRNIDSVMISRAMNITRNFIIERGLLLFGGLAIDHALRLKGSSIYSIDSIPDYDVVSTSSVDDAYDLADLLVNSGFENVSVVRGIHVQTMRVRANFIWLADIGYMEAEVYERVPSFDYQGMRVVHPDYQRMDIHLAMCFPFAGPPREDIFHRWKKDIARFNLLAKYYPIDDSIGPATNHTISATLPVHVTASSETAAAELKVAIHGFAAYAIIQKHFRAISGADYRNDDLKCIFPSPDTITIETPVGDSVIVASPWIDTITKNITVRSFDPYMDIYPESVQVGKVTILSTAMRLLAASVVEVDAGKYAYVVSPQYLLMWLLFESFRADDTGVRQLYRAYYADTLRMIADAENIYASADIGEFSHSIFAPTVSTIGDVNYDNSYIIRMANNARSLNEEPPLSMGLPKNISTMLSGLPANYNPGRSKKSRPIFDYENHVLFIRSGRERL